MFFILVQENKFYISQVIHSFNGNYFTKNRVFCLIELVNGVFLLLGDSLGDGLNCNSYLVKSGQEILLIDSGLGEFNNFFHASSRDPTAIMNTIIKDNLQSIKMMSLTHAHLDHIGGISSIDDSIRNQITVGAHKYEKPHLEQGDKPYIDPITRTVGPKIRIDKALSNGDHIRIGDLKFEVIHTAGHTEGSLCLYEPEKQWLFSGDTVFPMGSFGRVDFPGSNADEMKASLDTLRSLDVMALFAGHMKAVIGPDVMNQLNESYQTAKAIL
jgi:glyoxylase-like metal-dependent hydrolase (beta-lactamase superfamily II)